MPVYEQTYKHYEGAYRPANIAWMIIAAVGIRQLWRSKWIRFLLLGCLSVFFVNIGRIYLAANSEALELLHLNSAQLQEIIRIDATFYKDFLYRQIFFCFLMTLFVGSPLISLDRRRKNIALYLSKPLGRLDYLLGKGSIVFFYLCLITIVPTLLLLMLYAMFTDDWMYIMHNIPILMQSFTFAMVIVLPLVILILALSSLSKSTETTAVMFSVVFFLPNVAVPIMKQFTKTVVNAPWLREGWEIFSLHTIWKELGFMIFKESSTAQLHWGVYLASLLILTGLCCVIAYRKIQAVEVFK